MTGKDLLNKMELVDPEFIDAADKVPRKRPIKWQQWTALAACLTIAVISGVVMVISPDEGTVINVSGTDTASLFSSGGVTLILMVAGLLGALAVAALMIKDRRDDQK